MSQLDSAVQQKLDGFVERLRRQLGENLASCVLYGSAVRGDFTPGVSDINVLIILQESTPEAHAVVGELARGSQPLVIEPLVMGRKGLERSVQSFLSKFLSIRRNYKLLAGTDVLKDIPVDQRIWRFVCEQSLRNLRLRMKYSFMKASPQQFGKTLAARTPSVFVILSDVLRSAGKDVPHDFNARIPLFEESFSCNADVLSALLKLKTAPRDLTKEEAFDLHARLHRLLNDAIAWMEAQWPTLLPESGN